MSLNAGSLENPYIGIFVALVNFGLAFIQFCHRDLETKVYKGKLQVNSSVSRHVGIRFRKCVSV